MDCGFIDGTLTSKQIVTNTKYKVLHLSIIFIINIFLARSTLILHFIAFLQNPCDHRHPVKEPFLPKFLNISSHIAF